jgi:hypothetical protein
MAKGKASNSNKISFGKRKTGRAQKSFNKHNRKDKVRYGYTHN